MIATLQALIGVRSIDMNHFLSEPTFLFDP